MIVTFTVTIWAYRFTDMIMIHAISVAVRPANTIIDIAIFERFVYAFESQVYLESFLV